MIHSKGEASFTIKTIDPNLKSPTAQIFIKFIVKNKWWINVVSRWSLSIYKLACHQERSVIKLGHADWVDLRRLNSLTIRKNRDFLIKHKHHTHELYNSRVLKGVVIVSLDLTITAHLPPSLFVPGDSTQSLLILIDVTYKSGL